MKHCLQFAFVAVLLTLAGETPLWANAGSIKTNITTWNAGTVLLGSSNSTSITITNTSSIPVTVNSLSISGNSEFVSCCIALPKAIPPHGIITFGMNFVPTAVGGASATLTVLSTATNKPTVTLDGTGFQHSVDLTWGASSSTTDPCWQNFTYQVYVNPPNSGSFTMIPGSDTPNLFYADTNVVSGSTYSYVVTAMADYVASASCPGLSKTGLISAFSNVTTATIP